MCPVLGCDGVVMECEGKRYKIGTGIGAGAFGVVKLAADVAGGPAENHVVKLVRCSLSFSTSVVRSGLFSASLASPRP